MKLITVHEQEEGQKLLKLLGSYLKEASGGFLHKMLRMRLMKSLQENSRPQKNSFQLQSWTSYMKIPMCCW